jgi:hypothetical protein
MDFTGQIFTGHKLHSHGFGALGEVVQYPLTVPLLEVVLPPVGVLLAFVEHRVDQKSQFVGRRRRLCSVHVGAHAPVVSAQSRLARAQPGSSKTQRLGRAIGTALGLATHHLAASDLGARAQPQPGRKVLVERDLLSDGHKVLQ